MMNVMLLIIGFSGLFKGTINFTVKEAYTGRRTSCKVSVFKAKDRILTEHVNGKWKVLLKAGDYRFVFTKDGYFPLSANFKVKRDTVLNVTVYLSPEHTEDIFPPQVEGIWIIRGYVTDHDGKPIEGVKVSVKSKNMSTMTDKNGVFELSLPKEHVQITHDFIPEDTIILAKNGYKTYYREIYRLEENVVLQISMEKGRGIVFKEEKKSPGTGNSHTPEVKKNAQ